MMKVSELKSKWVKRFGAAGVMLVGCGLTFALVLVMNLPEDLPDPEAGSDAATFDVAPKKKPPKPKPKPQPKRPAPRTPRPPAPAPSLGAQLSGLSFGIPSLSGDSLGAAASDVVGDQDTGDLVMTEDTVDAPPRAVDRSLPDYPRRARAQGVEGKVVLGLLIGSDGEVMRVKVLESMPEGVFENAAIGAVKRWRFEPASYRGRSVKVWARQVVHFDLG